MISEVTSVVAGTPLIRAVLRLPCQGLSYPVAFAIHFVRSERVLLIKCIDDDDSIEVSAPDLALLDPGFVLDEYVSGLMQGVRIAAVSTGVNMQGYPDAIWISAVGRDDLAFRFESGASMIQFSAWSKAQFGNNE